MKMYGVGTITPPFLNLAIDGVSGQLHVSAALFIVWEAGGPQSLSARHGEEKKSCPCCEWNSSSLVVHSLVAILTELSQLLYWCESLGNMLWFGKGWNGELCGCEGKMLLNWNEIHTHVGTCGTENLISKVSRDVMAVLCLWDAYVMLS